jgi:hypothetical protein
MREMERDMFIDRMVYPGVPPCRYRSSLDPSHVANVANSLVHSIRPIAPADVCSADDRLHLSMWTMDDIEKCELLSQRPPP